MTARIFKQGKSAMQSGTAKADIWVLEFDQEGSKTIEPLMGWTGSSDTQTQVRLVFNTKEAAISYAEKKRIVYSLNIVENRKPVIRKNGYGENFATKRRTAWTH